MHQEELRIENRSFFSTQYNTALFICLSDETGGFLIRGSNKHRNCHT